VIKMVDDLLAKQGLTKEAATIEHYGVIAQSLRDFFEVTEEAAMVRLSQLAYIKYTTASKQARQVVTPVATQGQVQNRDAMIGHRTNRLGTQDFLSEYSRNEALRNILATGQFRFVEGYFAIDNPKYIAVTTDSKKLPTLTQYAREHLDECTLGFIYRKQNKGTPQSLTEILFRRQDEATYDVDVAYTTDNQNSAVLIKAKHATKNQSALTKAFADFKAVNAAYTFADALDVVLKVRNLQVQEAGWNSGIAVSQITRMKSGNHKHDLRILTQLCAGIGLEPTISRELLTKARALPINPNQEEYAYLTIIDTMSGNSIDEINKYLVSVNMTPFNKSNN